MSCTIDAVVLCLVDDLSGPEDDGTNCQPLPPGSPESFTTFYAVYFRDEDGEMFPLLDRFGDSRTNVLGIAREMAVNLGVRFEDLTR